MNEPGKSAFRVLMALALLSFLLPAVVAGYALLTMFEFEPVHVPDYVPAVHAGLARLLFDPWQHWDGQWFLRIAQAGYYTSDASAAFLPAYPWLVRAVAVLTGGDVVAAGCLVSWTSLVLALVVLWNLLRDDLEHDDRALCLVLLVTFPTAFYFHAAYTESLFLLLTAIAFAAARRGYWPVAGAAALVATLTRWTGFGLVPALLAEAWSVAHRKETSGGAPACLPELMTPDGVRSLRRLPIVAALSSLAPFLALPIYTRILDAAIGDPWGFSRAQTLWERHLAPPWMGLIDGLVVLLPGHPPYLDPLPGGFPRLPVYAGGFLEAHAYNLVAAIAGLAIAIVALRRLRASYGVWALAGVVVPLMTPSRLQPLQSMPRFLVVLFPLFAVLAVVLRGKPFATACTIAAFATLQGFFIARFTLWFWVA